MRGQFEALRRLGIVGAAAVVGLVPIGVLSTSAYAVSSASLSLASTVPGQTTSATNSFTVTDATATGTTEYLTIVANGGEQLPTAAVDYSVTAGGTSDPVDTSYTGTGAFAVTAPTAPATSPWTVTLPLTNPVAAGGQVVVTTTGVVNPSANVGVYFTDQASADSGLAAVNTNTVSVAGTASAAATVTSVNPQAFGTPGGEPFTIMGTGFGTTAAAAPTVCFVPVATTTFGANCGATANGVAVTPATGNTSTELQRVSPLLLRVLATTSWCSTVVPLPAPHPQQTS